MGSSEEKGYGYNDVEAMGIGPGINEVHQATVDAIKKYIEEDVVNYFSTRWYMPEAVNYFAAFKQLCQNASDDVKTVFDNFRTRMQANIDNWRKQVEFEGGEQLEAVSDKTIEIDVTSIKEHNDNNAIYMDEELWSTNWVENQLTGESGVRNHIIKAIGEAVSDHTVGSFIGGEQNDAINNAMNGLADVIAKIMDFLTVGENSLQSQIEVAKTKYETTAGAVKDKTYAGEGATEQYEAGANVEGGADETADHDTINAYEEAGETSGN